MKSKIVLIVLIGICFGFFVVGFVKADVTYTTIDEIEDFSCVDDSYIYSGAPNSSYGSYSAWRVGRDINGTYTTLVKFDLTNKPNNFIGAEIILNFYSYESNIIISAYFSNNSWTEEEVMFSNVPEIIPYPPIVLPFSFEMGIPTMAIYGINIMEYSDLSLLSIYLMTSGSNENINVGYSKEAPIIDVRPKIIWTVEVKHIIKEPIVDTLGYIPFMVLGLVIGAIGATVPFLIKIKKV